MYFTLVFFLQFSVSHGPRIVSEKMSLPFRIILLVTSLTVLSTKVLCQKTQIRIDPDGGYTGIVIKIDKDVPEDLCPEILTNLKVRKLCLLFHCFSFLGNATLWEYRYHLLSFVCLLPPVFGCLPSSFQPIIWAISGSCQAVIRLLSGSLSAIFSMAQPWKLKGVSVLFIGSNNQFWN